MANRGRNYMDRLLGRNEGSESRDFTDGSKYGEEESFFDDNFGDTESEWRRNRDRDLQDRRYRTQASRTRPRPGYYKTAEERDYSTRRNPPMDDTYRDPDYRLRSGVRDSSRPQGNNSFATGDFRNAGFTRGGFFGKGPKGYKRSDERIREEVSEALYRDYHVDASEIEVDVKEGIVTLSGTVDSRQSKRAAEECIENLTGVIDVHNRIRIAESGNVSNLRQGKDSDEKRALS